MTEAIQHPEKTRIQPKTEGMVKIKGGSFHKDDFLGHCLAGLTIEQVKTVATELGVDANKYDHLNVGQQRMNIGNRLRALTAHKDGMTDEATSEIDKNRDLVDRISIGFREANAAANAASADAKDAAADEKAAAKAAKPKKMKVPDPDPIDGEGDTPD